MSVRVSGRWLAFVATLAMVAAVAVGLWVLGTPAHQRALRLDKQRVGNLRVLRSKIELYARANKALPADLDAVDSQRRFSRDPFTGAMYGYQVLDSNRYRLCAHFDAASNPDAVDRSRFGWVPRRGLAMWRHPAGRHCYLWHVKKID